MTKPKAVATLAIGEFYHRMARLTHPLMRHYANRCGADFIVFDQGTMREKYGFTTMYEKFQVYDLLERYCRIAFFDTDILIARDCPSVFEVVPEHMFAAANEEKFSRAKNDILKTQKVLGTVKWTHPYFNAGVMVFGQGHKSVFDPLEPTLQGWATGIFRNVYGPDSEDQAYLNHRIARLGIPFMDIGHRFNHTRVITATHTRFRSHAIHYSGASGHRYGSRLKQIEKDVRVLNSPRALQISRKYPSVRWIVDRLDPAYVRYLVTEKLACRKHK